MPKQRLPPPLGDYIIILDSSLLMKRVTIQAERRIRIGWNDEVSLVAPSPFVLKGIPYKVSASGPSSRRVITLSEIDGDRVVTISLVPDGRNGLMRVYQDSTWKWRDARMRIVQYPELEPVLAYLDSFR